MPVFVDDITMAGKVGDKINSHSFLVSYHHHLPLMMASPASATHKLSPPVFSLPNKKLKLTPPSPPIPKADRLPPFGVEEADSPSVFNVLNIFRRQWFLNRDHLIANILSIQKDEHGKISWVDFQPMFHTHLVWRAVALLPPLCPIAKGKRCMFVFILEVLDDDGPGPYGSGSFFSIEKKAGRPHRPWHKPAPPPALPPPSQPPLPSLDCKIPKASKAKVRISDALVPPAWASSPLPSLSPLPTQPLPQGAGSSVVSPELVVSQTPMPGPPPVPLAPLNSLPSPVTLSQIEDIPATSELVWELHSRRLPSTPLSSLSLPPSVVMAVDDDPSPIQSCATSYTSWVDTHPAPTSGSLLHWTTWFGNALWNEVPKEGLATFIKSLSLAQNEMIREKFVQNRLQMLANAVCAFKSSPVPGT
jgi:hypothetical protein